MGLAPFYPSLFGWLAPPKLTRASEPALSWNQLRSNPLNCRSAEANTEEEKLVFSLSVEHQPTLRAFNLIPVKLDFFDHPFTCPLCKEQIVYTSMHTVIVSSLRKCPCRQGELLINEGTITAAITDKKAPKRVVLAAAKRSRK